MLRFRHLGHRQTSSPISLLMVSWAISSMIFRRLGIRVRQTSDPLDVFLFDAVGEESEISDFYES